jgi:hypothetical protein
MNYEFACRAKGEGPTLTRRVLSRVESCKVVS